MGRTNNSRSCWFGIGDFCGVYMLFWFAPMVNCRHNLEFSAHYQNEISVLFGAMKRYPLDEPCLVPRKT